MRKAHQYLTEWELEFEVFYYQRQVSRLHLVHLCIHAVLHLARETVRCGPLNLLAQWVLENLIGNLGREVHQHSNPFMNLCQRGLLRAQTIALNSIVPDLDLGPSLKRGSQPIGDGYVLLTAHEKRFHTIVDEKEISALSDFFVKHDEPGRDPRIINGKYRLKRWARMDLPNGQTVRCAWKEIESNLGRISRNVKVCLEIGFQVTLGCLTCFSVPTQRLHLFR